MVGTDIGRRGAIPSCLGLRWTIGDVLAFGANAICRRVPGAADIVERRAEGGGELANSCYPFSIGRDVGAMRGATSCRLVLGVSCDEGRLGVGCCRLLCVA